VSATAHVREDFWRRWLVPRREPLGSGGVGHVPRTLYLPIIPGALARYSTGHHDLSGGAQEIPRTIGAPRPGRRGALQRSPVPSLTISALRPGPVDRAIPTVGTRPFSEEELDRLFPPEASPPTPPPEGTRPSPMVLGETPPLRPGVPPAAPSRQSLDGTTPGQVSPAPLGRPSPEPHLASGSGPAGASEPPVMPGFAPSFPGILGGAWPTDLMDHPVDLEAINPVPPHLRARRAPEPGLRPAGRVGGSLQSTPARSCAMCGRQLWDFRTWGECPGCGDPVCEPCLRSSFVNGAEGHCSDCRAAPQWPAT